MQSLRCDDIAFLGHNDDVLECFVRVFRLMLSRVLGASEKAARDTCWGDDDDEEEDLVLRHIEKRRVDFQNHQ